MTPTAVPAPITVHGGDIVLRPWSLADAPQVAEACADPLIARWNPLSGTAEDWCSARADWSAGTHASWAIAASAQPTRVLGSISLFDLDREQETAEVGFWVAPQDRGKGIAAIALRIATRVAFADLDLSRVVLLHAVANAGSCRTAEAAGYLLEGWHRASYRYGDGCWHDEHAHARLRDDR